MSRLARARFERRPKTSKSLSVGVPLASVVLAGVIAGLVLLVSGKDPVTAYQHMFAAAFTNRGAFSDTLASATPLLLTGLAAAFAFRMRVWNLGGEGQLYIGAMAAAGVGIALGNTTVWIGMPLMVIAGIAAGALWATIPGLLKVFANTNEIITTLMFNYIGGLLIYYLIFDSHSYWRDMSPEAATYPQGKTMGTAGTWPGFVQGNLIVPLGFIVGIVAAVALFFFLRKTRFGFNMRVIADSPNAASYSGIRIRRTVLIVILVSGALAGIAGASQVGDASHALDPKALQGAQFAYTGIVAAALARYQPLLVIITAIALGALSNAGFAQQGADFPVGLIGIMQGILLFCVITGEVFIRYRLRITRPSLPRSGDDTAGAIAPAQLAGEVTQR